MTFLRNIIKILKAPKIDKGFVSEYTEKIVGLDAQRGKFETFIVGSSHIEVGYIPRQKEYNCGVSSLDLYGSYKLYQYANHDGLKNIIISFSSFSPFNSIINSPRPYLATILNVLCGIEYQDAPISKRMLITRYRKSVKREIKHIKPKLKQKHSFDDYIGNFAFYPDRIYQKDDELMTRYAINDFHRFLTLKHDPVYYLAQLIREAQQNNQKVFIVITPIIDKLYKDLMIPYETLFAEVYALQNNYSNVKVLDYYNDSRFTENDFYDWQHLNLVGAKKLTKIIRGDMKK